MIRNDVREKNDLEWCPRKEWFGMMPAKDKAILKMLSHDSIQSDIKPHGH